MVHNALSYKLRNMRMGNSLLFRQLKWMAILAVCLFLFCEWLIYYLVIFQCSWPDISLQDGKSQFQPLKTMFLTDTHLLGSRNGHWFDKLRREWQMERAFQTAISYFKPDVVFLLGDLFDEGMTSNDEVSSDPEDEAHVVMDIVRFWITSLTSQIWSKKIWY